LKKQVCSAYFNLLDFYQFQREWMDHWIQFID